MNNKIIIFNGPPKSGKDLFKDLLSNYISESTEYKSTITYTPNFKTKLVEFVLDYYGISIDEWKERYDNRELKETSWDKLDGLSQREALIDMSENKIKPALGKDFFGKCVRNSIKNSLYINELGYNIISLISDGGFKEELSPLIDEFGAENIIVFRLHRDGCDYTGDSRGWIQDDWFEGINIFDIKSGEHQETLNEIIKCLYSLRKEQK